MENVVSVWFLKYDNSRFNPQDSSERVAKASSIEFLIFIEQIEFEQVFHGFANLSHMHVLSNRDGMILKSENANQQDPDN